MNYTAENMYRMLGSEATDSDAKAFATHLLANGWELEEDEEGLIEAYRNGERMSEVEWQEALHSCVWTS